MSRHAVLLFLAFLVLVQTRADTLEVDTGNLGSGVYLLQYSDPTGKVVHAGSKVVKTILCQLVVALVRAWSMRG
jgi:hypothetical protein